jgi:phage shock protein A
MLDYEEKKNQEALEAHKVLMTKLGDQAAEMSNHIQELANIIEEYSAKQSSINEAIMRQRAIEEQE